MLLVDVEPPFKFDIVETVSRVMMVPRALTVFSCGIVFLLLAG
jgi:hypothetical protein